MKRDYQKRIYELKIKKPGFITRLYYIGGLVSTGIKNPIHNIK